MLINYVLVARPACVYTLSMLDDFQKSKCQGSFSGHLNGSLTKAYTTSCAKLSEDPQSTNLTSEMLIDSFGRMHTYLRISSTDRRNPHCQYCMLTEGVELTPSPQLLSQNEIVHLANLFASSGVDKIRLTCGEPTIRKGIEDMLTAV
ncbi:hypothetical protein H0E87_001799 [Populus deltoides]|uniref:Radical SAM core domain-containing protein n=1 Tax=Populus deltoides TaxID=3696 RepID=A0A8T2ZT42_POPDE|nr:hypothetical protein H0E87_001799 [Populus deltoides]